MSFSVSSKSGSYLTTRFFYGFNGSRADTSEKFQFAKRNSEHAKYLFIYKFISFTSNLTSVLKSIAEMCEKRENQ